MNHLNDKFLIAFEIGYEQGEDVKNLAYKYLDNIDEKYRKKILYKGTLKHYLYFFIYIIYYFICFKYFYR